MLVIRPCALCSFAEATIFMADVIWRVLLTELILFLTSFSEAMSYSLYYMNCLAIMAAAFSIFWQTSSLMTPFFSTSSTSSFWLASR